jgi:transcriptional regulator with XRE-family HTH domain
VRGGQLIREARRRAQLTQAELAQRTGTTQSAVARWETNRVSPTLETLTEVVRACGLDLVVHLEPHDDHDWTLVEAKQQLTPDQRLEDLESMVDLVNEGRAALRNG